MCDVNIILRQMWAVGVMETRNRTWQCVLNMSYSLYQSHQLIVL